MIAQLHACGGLASTRGATRSSTASASTPCVRRPASRTRSRPTRETVRLGIGGDLLQVGPEQPDRRAAPRHQTAPGGRTRRRRPSSTRPCGRLNPPSATARFLAPSREKRRGRKSSGPRRRGRTRSASWWRRCIGPATRGATRPVASTGGRAELRFQRMGAGPIESRVTPPPRGDEPGKSAQRLLHCTAAPHARG